MPFVPAADTAMAEMRYTWLGEQVENTLYFQASATLTEALMIDLGDALITWWNANLAPLQSQNLTLREVFVTDLSSATAPTVARDTGLPASGAVGSADLPTSNTLAISFRTRGRGRSSRGRNYILGLTEGQVTGNTVAGTVVSDYTDAYNLLIGGGLFVPGLVWCVVSRISGGAPRTSALVQVITAAFFVDDTIDSQRRRLPGRGR